MFVNVSNNNDANDLAAIMTLIRCKEKKLYIVFRINMNVNVRCNFGQ